MSSKTTLIMGMATVIAGADVVRNRFLTADGEYCGAGAKALGVTDEKALDGEACPVAIGGIVLVESGDAIVLGAGGMVAIKSDSTGRAVPATAFSVTVPGTGTAVTSNAAQPDLTEAGGVLPEIVNGYALDAASGAGELVRVKLCA
ncbi:MAG: DUF2190 family protein [Bacteroidetes bacterium]|nr:DUF2190 family protein [Bacteroidota bacterium]